jgi:hypothetical protein
VTTIKQLTGHLQAAGAIELPPLQLQGASLWTRSRVETLSFIRNLERTADWKTSLGAKEHRLEAYAMLHWFSGLLSDL